MNLAEYKKEESTIYNDIYVDGMQYWLGLSRSIAMTNANVYRHLPQIPKQEYLRFYQDTIFNQRKSALEQISFQLLKEKIIEINDSGIDLVNQDPTKPKIFATYHLGSYRCIASYIGAKHVNVVLIVDTQVYEEQKEAFMEVHQQLYADKNYKSDFLVLNSDKRETFFQLKQLINEGYVLIVYMDGNSGMPDSKNLLEIPFLNHQKINVRKGIGVLSYLLKAEIIPVLAYRDMSLEDKVTVHFYPPYKTEATHKDVYIEGAVNYCYGVFMQKLVEVPAQWEGWFYLEKWRTESQTVVEKIGIKELSVLKNQFNIALYSRFAMGDTYYVMNHPTYYNFEIEEELFLNLENPDYIKNMPEAMRLQLAEYQIII